MLKELIVEWNGPSSRINLKKSTSKMSSKFLISENMEATYHDNNNLFSTV